MYLQYFINVLLNNTFDDFGMWLLDYWIEFSCLYISQGHYFISTLWLWEDEFVLKKIERKSIFNVIQFSNTYFCPCRVAHEIVTGIVQKCLSASKPKTKENGKEIIMLYIEAEKQEIVSETVIEGWTNKNPKLVAAAVNVMTQALRWVQSFRLIFYPPFFSSIILYLCYIWRFLPNDICIFVLQVLTMLCFPHNLYKMLINKWANPFCSKKIIETKPSTEGKSFFVPSLGKMQKGDPIFSSMERCFRSFQFNFI